MGRLQGKNRTLALTVGVVIVMTSLSFAAVPFYNWFCRVTGYGGTPQVAAVAPDKILDQT
ncbi:MAG: cytochrome c oxidase assembly protein, partial [Tabrizicola sp.]|nr:cytochrome c oxidase assembly protein [Tabrizicola sp.]